MSVMRLELPADLRERLDALLWARVENAVSSCAERDETLRDLVLQNEGEEAMPRKGPWRNSCDLTDTVSREMHTTLLAALRQSLRYPYYLVEPATPSAREGARRFEDWFNVKLRYWRFDRAMYDVMYTMLESLYAPFVIEWGATQQRVFTEMKRDPLTGELVPEMVADETIGYEEQLVRSDELFDAGLRFRVPLPWNVYTYPASAASFRVSDDFGALGVIERMYLTSEDLWRGVDDLGFDEEAVRDLLRRGPSHRDDGESERTERLGIDSGGYYECYQYWGRLPHPQELGDEMESSRTLQSLQGADFVWLFGPDGQALRRSHAICPVRPYVSFTAFRVPNSLLGHGIVSLLRPIQEEMTAMLRMAIDGTNLKMAAPFMVPESAFAQVQKGLDFSPGGIIPVPDQVGVLQQVPVDVSGPQLGLEWVQYLYGRASQVAAAQGANSMLGGKVRKNAEVEFTGQMMQTKFDLVVTNLQRGLEDAVYIMLAYLLKFGRESEQVIANGEVVEIDAEDIADEYRIVPQVSSENINSQSRIERITALTQGLRASPYWQMRITQGDLSGEHKLMVRFAEAMGEREPQEIVGPEPQPAGTGGQTVGGMQPQEGGMGLPMEGPAEVESASMRGERNGA